MVQDPNAKCASYLSPRRAITLVEWRGAAGRITVGDGVPSRTNMRPHRRGKPCHRPNQPIEHRPQWCSKALYGPPPPGDVVHYPDNLGSKPPHYICITPILPSCLRPVQPPSLVVMIRSREDHMDTRREYIWQVACIYSAPTVGILMMSLSWYMHAPRGLKSGQAGVTTSNGAGMTTREHSRSLHALRLLTLVARLPSTPPDVPQSRFQ